MGLTGKFRFRKTLWGKIVLQIEEEVKPFWSKSGALKRRWRDATLMDLAAPEMRTLIDMRFRPHLRSQSSFAPEATSAHRKRDEAHGAIDAGAPVPNGEVRRIAH
jgi:hypothetical protein